MYQKLLKHFVRSVCFPAVSTKLCAVGGNDGVQLWSDKGQLLLHVLSQTSGVSVTSVRLSHDGRHLVSGWSDNCVRLHTPETGKYQTIFFKSHTFKLDNEGQISKTRYARHFYISENRERLPSIHTKLQKMLFSGKLVEEVRNCVTGKEGVTCLGLGRQVMLVGGADGCVTLWSLPTFSNAKLIKTVRLVQ